ncbi:MAG: CHAT domain-containing protein [Aureispira sp.]|nr:CHAT domain-containing protein [Aureispira sp.]
MQCFRLLLCLLSCLATEKGIAQYYPKLDSLVQDAKNQKLDSLIISRLEHVQQEALKDHGRLDTIYWHYTYQKAQYIQEHERYEIALLIYDTLLQNIDSSQYHYWCAKSLYNQALCSYRVGQQEQSFELWKQCYAQLNQANACPNDLLCLKVTMDLAIKLTIINDYDKALKWNKKALDVAKTAYGDSSKYYAFAVKYYGEIFLDKGEYTQAEKQLKTALTIYRKLYSEKHPHYISALATLASVYQRQGDIINAKSLFQDIEQVIRRDTNPNKNIQQLLAFNEVIAFYKKIIYESLVNLTDTMSLAYGSSIEALAELYYTQNDFEKARKLYEQVLRIYKKHWGEKDTDVATMKLMHAQTLSRLEQYEQATSIYQQALKTIKKKLGKKHKAYIEGVYGQLSNKINQSSYEEAIPQYKEYLRLTWNRLNNYQNYLSEQEQLSYLSSLEDRYHMFYSFVLDHNKNYPSLTYLAAQNSLQFKATSLNYKRRLKHFWSNNTQDSLYRTYQEWVNLNYQLASIYTETENKEKVDSLTKVIYAKERTLVTKAGTYAKNWKKLENPTKVCNKLHKRSVAIDFVRFRYYKTLYTSSDTVYYGAIIYTEDSSAIQFLSLCSEKQLIAIFNKKITDSGNNFVTNASLQEQLYQLVWQPLEKIIGNRKEMHLVLSGLLQQLPFELLKVSSTKSLMDNHQIHYYNSLKDFVFKESFIPNSQKRAILLGDIQFDTDSLSLAKRAIPNQWLSQRALPKGDSLRNSYFTKLAATQKEVEGVQKLLEAKNWKVSTKTKTQATEEFIKTEAEALVPNVLHLATHGFYLKEQTVKERQSSKIYHLLQNSQNVLMQSGLALAGANYVWQGHAPIKGVEDGILTAYEATQLDLHQTDLVVLSACQTGQGEIHDTEGVMGLQRAFKQAGANNLIVSLWPVSDQVTAELMLLFYKEYAKGKTAYQALKTAKNKIRRKYKAPFYWAAFVLIE